MGALNGYGNRFRPLHRSGGSGHHGAEPRPGNAVLAAAGAPRVPGGNGGPGCGGTPGPAGGPGGPSGFPGP
uniref:Uncharacterized protein n=1 Tax=Desulfobacca acetoxidans TaxID=60893 RepID=A0A7V4G7Y8_9BACT